MKKQLLLVFLLPTLYSCIPQAFVVPQIVIADSSPKASSTAIVTVSPSFAPSVEPTTPTGTITPMATVTPVSTTGNSIPTGSPASTVTPSPTATPRSGGGGGSSSGGGGGTVTTPTPPPIQASATINPDNTGVR
ncbi:hypothetical protein EON78_04280 [bacterium]|nr:MAG: hypothetical protein EON78_04280 [bacterium]